MINSLSSSSVDGRVDNENSFSKNITSLETEIFWFQDKKLTILSSRKGSQEIYFFFSYLQTYLLHVFVRAHNIYNLLYADVVPVVVDYTS